ncbi:MAG: tetratricopeptide repeat protein [Anaerolineae bacterium]
MRASDGETLRRVQSSIPSQLVDKVLRAGKEIEGERRTVTVLFADVVGFTTLSERLDPEIVYGIINACADAYREAVYKHEGWLDKFIGDGVMALFGAPIAHEDDGARAVRCALDIQDALRRINTDLVTPHGFTLQIRIGLNLGTVVVGDLGSDLRMEYTALGDTVNVASRLQSVAEPGAILASRSVYDQARALFQFRELGSIRLRGRVEPVEIFEVEGVRREPGRVRGIPGLAAPMVGREKERAQIDSLLDTLLAEQTGSAILITGEPGIGKSRLLAEFKRYAAESPVQVFEAGCLAYGQSPYAIFVALLSAALDLHAGEDPATARAKIEKRIRAVLPKEQSPAEVLPYIEHLLGVPTVDQELAERIRHLDASQLRRQIFLAVRDLLVALARQQTLLLILEDLHWIDKLSLNLLLFLFNAVETAPLSLVCTARPTDNDIAVQIQRVGATSLGNKFVQIALQPLSLADSTQLVDLLLTIDDLPEPLRRLISQRAEGNPFYLEEIIHMLIDRRIITRRGEHWEMMPDADLMGLEVPRTLEGLIMTRVDNLPEATRYTLQCAAVIGRDFNQGLLQRITNGNAPRLESHLQDLEDHGLVITTAYQPERKFSFRHILTHQTVYNGLLLRRREHLHQKIAGAIEELYRNQLDDYVERLAFHYSESKDAIHALPYLLKAGERAAGRFANEQALEYYRTAQELSSQAGATLEQRVQIFSGMGDAQNLLGDYESALASYRTALELERTAAPAPEQARTVAEIARRLGRVCDRRSEYEEALRWLDSALYDINRDATSAQAIERARIYLDTGWEHYHLGHIDDARQWLNHALDISEKSNYYAEVATAFNRLAALSLEDGDWPRNKEFAEHGLSIRERIGDTDGIARSHLTLGSSAALRGEWTEAIEHFKASLDLNRRMGQPQGIAGAYTNLGHVYLSKGDSASAREYIESSLGVAQKIHATDQICEALNLLAEVEDLDQHWTAAIQHLQASMQMAAETGAKERLAQAAYILGEAQLGAGQPGEAERSARHSLQLAQEIGSKPIEASAYRVLGAIERAGLRWREAESDLSRSIGIFNQLKNQYEAARAELELALLYEEQGVYLDARSLLQRCLDTFTRFDVQNYIERTEKALVQVRAQAARMRH